MESRLTLDLLPQPDSTTCGPTALQAVYRYYGDDLPLEQVIAEVQAFEGGGTFAVFLACHALARGYRARIYTYNLQLFDPTWLAPGGPDLRARLALQASHKTGDRLQASTRGYLRFLELGGEILFQDLNRQLLRHHLSHGRPVLTGLSATYLYQNPRERGSDDTADDVRGEPVGHFVVLCGYDRERRQVLVADPFQPNPVSVEATYLVGIDRLICAVLLGVITYDANLLVIEPRAPRKRKEGHATADSGQ